MSKISLTRCQFFLPFTGVLSALGAPTEALLERFKLPVNLEERINDYVPLRNALRFTDAASRIEGIPDLGSLVAQGASFEYLSRKNRRLVSSSPTLFYALKVLCANAHIEDTNLSMFMAFHGSTLRLHTQLAGVKGLRHLEHSQWLQNVIPIHVVREFAGPAWVPVTMAFEADYRPGMAVQEQWPGIRFLGGQPSSWIDIPVDYLGLPPIAGPSFEGPFDDEEVHFSGKLVDTLKLMLPSYLGGKVPSVNDVAEMANTSSRNFQRMLADSGFSYRRILNIVRFERAAALLHSAEIKIVDIAQSLGYADGAHFTRAFRSMAGQSPSQFRESRMKL